MENIDTLRKRLHESIERGNKEEWLRISQELDIEIVRLMRKRISDKEWKLQKQEREQCMHTCSG